MDFLLVVLYAVINVIVLSYLLNKHSILSPGMIVFSFYVLVAVLAVPAYKLLPEDNYFKLFDFTNIGIFPYILYFVLSLILIWPLFSYPRKFKSCRILVDTTNVKLFVYVFTLFSMLAIYVYARMLSTNSVLENLDTIRQENYDGVQIKAYRNQFEHLALLITHYFDLPAKILLFYILSNNSLRNKIPVIWLLFFSLGSILPGILDASRTASRIMAVNSIIELLLCYSVFKRFIPKNVKHLLYGGFVLFCVLMFTYTYLVTKARFGMNGDDSTLNSLICYLGQPTLIFNSQVIHIDEFAFGARFFYPVFKLFGSDPTELLSRISGGWGVCFSTMIGDLWQDFSILTIIIIPFIALTFQKWLNTKSSLGLSHIYIMLFYANTILKGALVTGYGMCVDVAVALLMCYFIKVYFNVTKS